MSAPHMRYVSAALRIHLHVNDCDTMVQRLRENGAEILMEPADMFWGERFARARDPHGHEWGIAQKIRDMTPEEIQADKVVIEMDYQLHIADFPPQVTWPEHFTCRGNACRRSVESSPGRLRRCN